MRDEKYLKLNRRKEHIKPKLYLRNLEKVFLFNQLLGRAIRPWQTKKKKLKRLSERLIKEG